MTHTHTHTHTRRSQQENQSLSQRINEVISLRFIFTKALEFGFNVASLVLNPILVARGHIHSSMRTHIVACGRGLSGASSVLNPIRLCLSLISLILNLICHALSLLLNLLFPRLSLCSMINLGYVLLTLSLSFRLL